MNTPKRRFSSETIGSLLLDTSPYLSCDACFEQIDGYVEKVLADPAHQDIAMQVHLEACGACAEEAAALTELLGGTVRHGEACSPPG